MTTHTIVIEGKQCPNCGRLMAAGALSGLCPSCLLAQGAETEAAERGRFRPPPLEQVRQLFPQLEIVSLLGAGGMGAVYKARQASLDRWVALKVLPAQDLGGVSFAERFNREARALARLSHPNIVAVHEFGQAGTLHFFIMEFVDGANLRQLEEAGRLSPREGLQIIPQICDALQYAHDEGVVHRDIKPENVLVDRKGRVKIADFGLAKIMGQNGDSQRLTAEGQVMGTPHYMAPEQVERPLAVDHRADIFSLGVVFYEMLTGDLPLGKFPPPSQKVELDVRLDEVVLRALENDPERRFQRVQDVKTSVETISGTPAPVPASPTPELRTICLAGFPVVIERGNARILRWKGILAAVALIFGLISLGFAFVSAVTGRSLFGFIGIVGWPSVVARLILSVGIVAWAVRRRFNQEWDDIPRTSKGTTVLVPKPWFRNRHVILTFVLLLALTWTIFQENEVMAFFKRSARDSHIQVGQVAARDPSTRKLIARLPGGGTIELLAVGNPGTGPSGWWAADGTLLGNFGFEVRGAVENSSSDRVSKDVLFRSVDLPDGASMAGYFASPDSGFGSGGQVFREGKPVRGGVQARFAWLPSVRRADLHVGFGLEPWRTIATISANGNSQNQVRRPGDPNWTVNFHHQPTATLEGSQVGLVFGPESRMWLNRVVAVDTNGVEHTANNAQGTPIEKVILWTHTFHRLPLGVLKEFRVQVRPVHWVKFEHIALEPNAPIRPSEPLTFGPVIERTFNEGIDFDSGLITNLPPGHAGANASARDAEITAWMRANGLDATVAIGELRPMDMDFVVVGNNEWDTLDAGSFFKRAYESHYRPSFLKPDSALLPATFGFRTREHGLGLLQILAFDEQKPGAKIRYKLLQRGTVQKNHE